jgi:hypothetical protein
MAQGTIKIVTPQNSREAVVTDENTNTQIPVHADHLQDHMQDGQSFNFDIDTSSGQPVAVNLRPHNTDTAIS